MQFDEDLSMIEDFEFQPDYDAFDYFMDDMIPEPTPSQPEKERKIRSINVEDSDLKFEKIQNTASQTSGKRRIKKLEITP